MAKISIGEITQTTIELIITDIITDYDDRTIYFYKDDVLFDDYSLTDGRSSTTNIVQNLDPGTTYTFYVRIEGEVPELGTTSIDWSDEDVSATTLEDDSGEDPDPDVPSDDRPYYFEWEYAKIQGRPFVLTASEWCDLLDNINAVLEYKGKSKMKKGTGVATFTYPDPNDQITALMYNQCIYAMSEHDNVGWIDYDDYCVSPGDPIYASGDRKGSLNFLRDMINSID